MMVYINSRKKRGGELEQVRKNKRKKTKLQLQKKKKKKEIQEFRKRKEGKRKDRPNTTRDFFFLI